MKYKLLRKVWLIVAGLALGIHLAPAQQTESFYDPETKYRIALELFSKEKYSASRDLFTEFLGAVEGASQTSIINAHYYVAICAIELFHPDAIALIEQFLATYPESIKARRAVFEAGRLMYKQKKYKAAIGWLEQTDIGDLNNEEISEYYFDLGYSYFSTGDLDNALTSFSQIRNVESKYETAAQYYYAHINYQKSNLNTALEEFEKLKDSESFGPVVPYYIIQIYYEQKRYEDLIKYAKSLEGRNDLRNSAEINRFIAESYYRKGDYATALKLFTEFEQTYPKLSREDFYQLGNCYYQTKNYDRAITYFEKCTGIADAMQQNAYYNLADCFLKTDKKQNARSSFQFASKADFNKSIKEEALFNYAKLSAELNFQPVAINAMNDFIKEFPDSKHIDEINELIAQLYITTRNYKDALAALDKIKSKSQKARKAYQKVAYYRGIEYFNDRDYETAKGLFTKAIVTEEDQSIRSKAIYWKAEAIYNQGDYDAAIKQYRIFIFNPKSVNESIYNTANYNVGYCYFKKEDYKEANIWFRKYLQSGADGNAWRKSDALIRSGDCFFMTREYESAYSQYEGAIKGNSRASDYCLFQSGMIQGIQGNMKGKAATMAELSQKYPKSHYVGNANYERGTALMTLDRNDEAEGLFRKVIADYPESEYAKKSMMKQALIKYNKKEDTAALEIYKNVVKKYSGSDEAAEALTGMRNIYVASGNPQGYFDFVNTVPAMNISTSAQDSITYEAAEQLYLKGKTDAAASGFDSYLNKYPEGIFSLNATFYKAECDYRKKDFDAALAGYTKVVNRPRSIFTEKSLLKAGAILQQNDKCTGAIELYKRLEETADYMDNIIAAQNGLMRCYYKEKSMGNVILYGRKLMENDKVDAGLKTDAQLYVARASMANNDLDAAQTAFKNVVSKIGNSEAGAESRYNLAYILYLKANYKESQKKCFEVVNQVPSYEYWIAKSFILLGDNYLALKDTFQAKHTYMSILENYQPSPNDPEDLSVVARQKVDAINTLEGEKMQKEIQRKEEEYIKNEIDTIVTGEKQ